MVPKKSTQRKEEEQSQPAQSMIHMDGKELSRRLEWIDAEISILSTQTGLSERILALNFTRAQFLAVQLIQTAMATSRGSSGLAPQAKKK